MAIVKHSIESLVAGVKVVTWGPMARGDVGVPVMSGPFDSCCVQVYGIFGSGGQVLIEGSNDTAEREFLTLKDGLYIDLAISVSGFRNVQERPLLTRPLVAAGDNTTAVMVKATLVNTNGRDSGL